MVRRVRYSVAMSLDGFIAGPNGEFDWIIMDPDIDFDAIFKQFDTVLMGRKTYEAAKEQGGGGGMPGMAAYVFSRTLTPGQAGGLTISADAAGTISELKKAPGKDIWLFGGGGLFGSLLDKGLVDSVEVAIIPVLLGAGIPLLPPPAKLTSLKLSNHRVYEKTGTVSLDYDVVLE